MKTFEFGNMMMLHKRLIAIALSFFLFACVGEEESLFGEEAGNESTESLASADSNFYVLQNKATSAWVRPKSCDTGVDESVSLVQSKAGAIDQCAMFEFVPVGTDTYYIKNKVTNAYFRPRECSDKTDESVAIAQIGEDMLDQCAEWKTNLMDDGYVRLENSVNSTFIRSAGCQGGTDETVEITQVPNTYTGACTLWNLVDAAVLTAPAPVDPVDETPDSDNPQPTPVPTLVPVKPPEFLDPTKPTPTPAPTPVVAQSCSSLESEFFGGAYAVIEANCANCHIGANAKGGDFKLANGGDAVDLKIFKGIASKTSKGESYMALKPLGGVGHAGGSVLNEADQDFQVLNAFIPKAVVCTDAPVVVVTPVPDKPEPPKDLGPEYGTPYEQLHRITMAMGSRLPTAAEVSAVNAANNRAALKTALGNVVDDLMTEENFYLRLKEMFNDLLLTDVRADSTGKPYNTFRDQLESFEHNEAVHDSGYKTGTYGIAKAPLELVEYVFKNNRPFTEILTADYLMVNPYSARAYGAQMNENFLASENGDDFRPARNLLDKDGVPMPIAGVLGTAAFLDRYPTTFTNRNRARAKYVFSYFLDTDIENLFNRDTLDLDNVHGAVPTYEDPQCTVCHDVIDPVAGLFKNWGNRGSLRGPTLNWFHKRKTQGVKQMLAPGYTTEAGDLLPEAQEENSVKFLASKVANDERFPLKMTKVAFNSLTGVEPDAKLLIFLQSTSARFVNNNYNFKTVIKDVILSDYFLLRNIGSDDNANNFAEFGTARVIAPEQLDRKIAAVLGEQWRGPLTNQTLNSGTYRLPYGGIDSVNILKRQYDSSDVMGAIQQRIAQQMSCQVVAADLNGARNLFPHVTASDFPNDGTGGVNKTKRNIAYLFQRILGQDLSMDDPEVTAAYDLFVAVRNTTDGSVPSACRGGAGASDANKTVVPWMATISYLLSDYTFLYE